MQQELLTKVQSYLQRAEREGWEHSPKMEARAWYLRVKNLSFLIPELDRREVRYFVPSNLDHIAFRDARGEEWFMIASNLHFRRAGSKDLFQEAQPIRAYLDHWFPKASTRRSSA